MSRTKMDKAFGVAVVILFVGVMIVVFHLFLPLIRTHADQEVIVNTDGWASYDGLVDMGIRSVTALITVIMSLSTARITSMVSKDSGGLPKID
jgi:uncharacterized protein (AIM24 family)